VEVEMFNADKRKYRKTADMAKLIIVFAILPTLLKLVIRKGKTLISSGISGNENSPPPSPK
jgi:hypothetical protein